MTTAKRSHRREERQRKYGSNERETVQMPKIKEDMMLSRNGRNGSAVKQKMKGRLYEKCAEIEKMQIKRQNKDIADMKKTGRNSRREKREF